MTVTSTRRPGRVGVGAVRDILCPEHREIRVGHLALRGQIQPDLKQLEPVRPVPIEERKHLGVHDAPARRQPLDVAHPESRRRPERIGVIDVAASDDGDGFEAAVRMLREPGDDVAVIHAPAIRAGEVLADLVAGERGVRPEAVVSPGEVIDMVNAE